MRLFGVSPDLGTIRGDYCGVLMPCTRDVTEVTDEWIRIERGRSWRPHSIKMPDMVPARDVGK
ncbi:hypothetical protein ACQVP2_27155 [Methylobacterium aquaticum]|uniref:hypothetical protein n=1 Tax=Methylobacterium aquaticum TaxID=270351 RepID=UPI003D17F76D